MKKTLLSLSIIATMVAALFNLSSCGNDDSTPTPAPSPTITAVEVYITTVQTQYMQDSLDIYTIVDKSNKDTLTGRFNENNTVRFTVPASQFPIEFTARYYWMPKEGVAMGDDIISINKTFYVDTYYVMSDGKKQYGGVFATGYKSEDGSRTTGARLLERLTKDNFVSYSIHVTINEKGETDCPWKG